MTFPRRAGLPALALLTVAAALAPWRAAAQSAPSKPQSPNGKVVFQSTQGGDGYTNDIYVMDADGKRQTRLTDSVNDDSAPVWSPQGDKIAFVSDRRGAFEIFLMNADGSNQRPLRADGPVVGFDFVWSPDGTRLAYPADGDIYVVEVVAPGGGDSTAAPSNISAVSKPAGSLDLEPSWAPGGGRLVIRNATNCPGCSDLYTLNADGTGRTQLTSAPGAEANPRWSPAGQQIAYEYLNNGRDLYVVNADGAGAVKVCGDVGSFGPGTWSPDGTRLAFISGVGANVYAANADGSGLTQLSDLVGTGKVFWSPDGAKVAFHSAVGSYIDIYVVNADGSRRATNYTKTRRDDEFASTWQKVQ
ncbi:MAG TPA: LpqB family beta-propeller domain-containing protein [Pyrinomonadaceae bacterium]|jgi:TolB protein